jgi:phosphohistidine phosphatase
MQQLMILRHAEAEAWSPDKEDFPRKLQAMGVLNAQKVAKWMLEELDAPQHILCSPAQRTRETLAPLLMLQPGLESVTHFVPQIYNAAASTLELLLDSAFTEADRVLIIGHNPGLDRLTHDVIHARHYEEFHHLSPSALVVVDFASGWLENHARGLLRHHTLGKQL